MKNVEIRFLKTMSARMIPLLSGIAVMTSSSMLHAEEFLPLDEKDSSALLQVFHANGVQPIRGEDGLLHEQFSAISCTIISIPMIHRFSRSCSLLDNLSHKEISLWQSAQVNTLLSVFRKIGIEAKPLHPLLIGDYSFKMKITSLRCDGGDAFLRPLCYYSR